MRSVTVDIAISSEEYLKLYQGKARDVVADCREGYCIRFPANILQRYVTRNGILGSFRIYYDDNNKFQSIVKLK